MEVGRRKPGGEGRGEEKREDESRSEVERKEQRKKRSGERSVRTGSADVSCSEDARLAV